MAFYVNILAPTHVVMKDLPIKALFLPTSAGDIEMFPRHMPLLSVLHAGIIKISPEGEENGEHYFFVESGVCHLVGEKMHLMVHGLEKVQDIDLVEAGERVSKIESQLSQIIESNSAPSFQVQDLNKKLVVAKKRRDAIQSFGKQQESKHH